MIIQIAYLQDPIIRIFAYVHLLIIIIYLKEMYYIGSRERTREKSRSPRRSRDRKKERKGKSSSSSRDQGRERKDHNLIKNKRSVRFQKDDRLLDVKYFKKEDEPNAKNLTDADIYEYKLKLEKENHKNIYLDSEEIKHKQSLMERDNMKKAKQDQKSLNQKLLSSKQEIAYYLPLALKKGTSENGTKSVEKEAHSQRISNILGCYYAKISEIPDQPSMDSICNDLPSNQPPKNIAFQQSSQKDKLEVMKFTKQQIHKQVKPLKGILKRSIQELKKMRQQALEQQNRRSPTLDADFLRIFREISTNKDKYTKQQIQLLLKPFKDNGTLESNLKKMKQMSETTRTPPPTSIAVQNIQKIEIPQNYSNYAMMNRTNIHAPPPPINPNNNMVPMNYNNMNYNNMMRNTKVQKYKTVPCKYFHGPQGCEKKIGCTFIHDEAYAGRVTPQMQMRYHSHNPHAVYTQQQAHQSYGNYGLIPHQSVNNNIVPNMIMGNAYQGLYPVNYNRSVVGTMPPPPPPSSQA